MTDKNRDPQTDLEMEDTISKVVTLSPEKLADEQEPSGEFGEATNTALSLGRLEDDLKQLQSKWRAVEREIADREKQVAALERTVESGQEKISALETDLATMSSHNATLSEQLVATERQVDEWKGKCDELSKQVQSRNADLTDAKEKRDVLLDRIRQLADDLDEQKNGSANAQEFANSMQSKNAELRAHIQELQDYIDGRKGEWDRMRSQLRDYENTVKGMSGSLDAHEDIVAEKEAEKAALAQKVMGLERELAALQGRQCEREADRQEMKEALDKQARELGSLSARAEKLDKHIEKLQKELTERDETVRQLRGDLEERGIDRSKFEERLGAERVVIAEQALRIEELEGSLHGREESEKELRQEVAAADKKIDELATQAADKEIRATELEAMLSEIQSERRDLEKELHAQRGLVEVLEGELQSKQDNLNALDRSVNRISEIGSEIRELDLLIDDRWHQQPKSLDEQADELFADDVLIEPEELFAGVEIPAGHFFVSAPGDDTNEIRYPLRVSEMTIGRSRKNDIQIKSKYISRVHARIKVMGDEVFIEDAGSKNGFLVNSTPVTLHKLTHGDTVEFGMRKFHYINTSDPGSCDRP